MLRYFFPALLLFCLVACKNDPKPVVTDTSGLQDPDLAKINALLAQSPDNDTLLYLRAKVYYKLQGYDEAMRDLNEALQRDSMQPMYYHLLADVLLDYARPNDSKRAIDVMKLAAQRFPERTETLLKLSEFQLIVAQHGDALSTLDKILQRDPQNADAFFMTGRIALDMRDTLRAITALQKSVKYDADNADAWFFLGRIFSERNNPQAIQFFDNALRVDSMYDAAREFKAVFYKRQGKFEEAFKLYRDILARNPDYVEAYFDIGMIYLEQDSLQKAYTNFDIATKKDVLFVKAFYYRGICAELEGNLAAALNDYKIANKMSPDFVEAKAARARLEGVLKK